MRKTTIATAAALCFVGLTASACPQMPSVGLPPGEIITGAWTFAECQTQPAMANGTAFADTDAFDCSLKNALRDRPGVVTLGMAGADVVFTTSTGNRLDARLPPRLERWAAAVASEGNKVAICETSEVESWVVLLGIIWEVGKVLMDRLSPGGHEFYNVASGRHMLLDAQSISGGQQAKLTAIRFVPVTSTPNSNCKVVGVA